MSRGTRLILVLLVILSLWTARTVQTTCYDSKGNPFVFNPAAPVEGWMPCNLTADISSCCSPRDYCMSNGMCLDAVRENMVAQHGCTDPDWGEPCHNYCKGTESSEAGLHFLWRCNGGRSCCNSNGTTSCCDDPDVETFLLEVGQNLHHPPSTSTSTTTQTTASSTTQGAASSISSGKATETAEGAASGTAQNSAASGGAVDEDNTNSTEVGNGDVDASNNRAMQVGLGVGIPLGLGIIAAVCFLALQVRKRGQQQQSSHMPQGDEMQQQQQYGQWPHAQDPYKHPSELSNSPRPPELDPYVRPPELEASDTAYHRGY